jgi:hypothetical protein
MPVWQPMQWHTHVTHPKPWLLAYLILPGYKTNDFAKQLTKDIDMGSIEGATLTNQLLYVSCQLVIPQDL